MKNILYNKKEYHVLVDYTYEPISSFSDADLQFFSKSIEESSKAGQNAMVEIGSEKVKICFVGEFTTPERTYLSLPKNFDPNIDNLALTIKMLNTFKDLKKDGELLISNFSFSASVEGIKSDLYYFRKLKEFFLDYITYEFIYPKKKIEVHSRRPIRNARLDVVSTERESDRRGFGLTYKVKDIANSKDWNLDDIYYSTICDLCDRLGSENDRIHIKNMTSFLKEEGYVFERIEIGEDVLDQIRRCETGIKHFPISNTLISYYGEKSVSDKCTIKAFYTKNFEYVWEFFSRIVFKYSDSFKKEVSINKMIITKGEEVFEHDDVRPDVFSDYEGHKFIGDCKYYKNIESDYLKEMYEYNEALGNKYPMAILVPSDKTILHDKRERGKFELFVIKISAEEVVNDVISGKEEVIRKVQSILKNSSRWI